MSTEATLDDPIEYFLQDQEFHGKSGRTLRYYERVLRDFESFLADGGHGSAGGPNDTQTESIDPAEADRRACMAWVHALRERVAPSTVATYASYLNRFYGYMTRIDAFDANPMALVMEEMDESIDADPQRRDATVSQMRGFVAEVAHPLDRAVVVTLLKTGLRVGELCNLDCRDLTLDHPAEGELGLGERPQLDNRSDTLYVDADPTRGDRFNGEERTASNKRVRDTLVPIDDELKHVLLRWFAVRPDAASPAEPLFVNTRERWGQRLQPEEVRYAVKRDARSYGWYRTGGGASENVTPHYFRHFFTTHLRDRTGDRGVVKYLRGDVADDVIDTYTHNWGDRVREVYEANVYSLL